MQYGHVVNWELIESDGPSRGGVFISCSLPLLSSFTVTTRAIGNNNV